LDLVFSGTEVAPDPECRIPLRQDSAFFFRVRTRTRSQKFVKIPDLDPMSLFNFGSSRSLCGHFLSKTWVNYGWIDDCSRSLNRSRILKFEKFPDPVSSEIFDLCEISDLLLFVSYFAFQNKKIKFEITFLTCVV